MRSLFMKVGRNTRLLILSLAVGVVVGLMGLTFVVVSQALGVGTLFWLAGYHPPAPAGETVISPVATVKLVPWLLPIIAFAGGLINGAIVYRICPEAAGPGIDLAIRSYHQGRGLIRRRVPFLKLISSSLTLGTGGSAGREGPIAYMGAALASWIGRSLRLPAAETRILLAAGVGAGVASVFRAPLAGAILAGEILYRSTEIESEVIVPAALSSVVSYCIFDFFLGWNPLFAIPNEVAMGLVFREPQLLVVLAFLAIVLVVLARWYAWSLSAIGAAFRKTSIPTWLVPAVGAGLSSTVGWALYEVCQHDVRALSVLSTGFGIIQELIANPENQTISSSMVLLLVGIACGKLLTTSLTIGSGGSGGLFGPAVVIGGCAGAVVSYLVSQLWPWPTPPAALFVMLGMAGFFTAAAKTPLSTLVIISEMTGSYQLLLPSLWVCAICFAFSGRWTIFPSQLESRSRSPAHQGDFIASILDGLSIDDLIRPANTIPVAHPEDSVAHLVQLFSLGYTTIPVVDRENKLEGVIGLDDVRLAGEMESLAPLVIAEDLVRPYVKPLMRDDNLSRALELFIENDLSEIPVVDKAAPHQFVGVVRRIDLSLSYLRKASPSAS